MEGLRSFSSTAGRPFRPSPDLDLAEGDRLERLTGVRVSSVFFRVLGMEPLLGREFTREEEQPKFASKMTVRVLGGEPT